MLIWENISRKSGKVPKYKHLLITQIKPLTLSSLLYMLHLNSCRGKVCFFPPPKAACPLLSFKVSPQNAGEPDTQAGM